MEHSKLASDDTSEIELQGQLVGDNVTTITMHIPKSLKEARARGKSMQYQL